MSVPGEILASVFEGATAGVREALPFIDHLARQALPANEIIRQVRAAGLTVRRAAALEAIRTIKGVIAGGRYIQAVRNDFLPNPDRVPTAATLIRRNYSYKVRVRGFDPQTGDPVERHISITTDTLMSKNDVYNIAADTLASDHENYGVTNYQLTVVELKKSPAL